MQMQRKNHDWDRDIEVWLSRIIRLAAVVVGAGVLWASWQFSVAGFGFEVPGSELVAMILATFGIIAEMAFNENGLRNNRSVIFIGIFFYIYGTWTNIIGVWYAQGQPSPAEWWRILFAVIVGVLMEVAPETLIVWGLIGITRKGDAVGSLFDLATGKGQIGPATARGDGQDGGWRTANQNQPRPSVPQPQPRHGLPPAAANGYNRPPMPQAPVVRPPPVTNGYNRQTPPQTPRSAYTVPPGPPAAGGQYKSPSREEIEDAIRRAQLIDDEDG